MAFTFGVRFLWVTHMVLRDGGVATDSNMYDKRRGELPPAGKNNCGMSATRALHAGSCHNSRFMWGNNRSHSGMRHGPVARLRCGICVVGRGYITCRASVLG